MHAGKKFTVTSQAMVPLYHHHLILTFHQIQMILPHPQQVHYPFNLLQPGPIFFLTPRKCSLFGVNCEAIPRQVNFLTDEAADCGKGANAVISQLHYFFCHRGLGEKVVFLHCDNCCGQNKNSCMLQYLMWRSISCQYAICGIAIVVL